MTSPVRGVGPISVAARRCVGRTRGRRQASRKRKRTGRRRRRRRRRRRLGCRWAPVKIRWTGRRELQSRPRVAAAPASILTIRFGFFGQRTPGRLFSAPLRPGRQRVSAFFFCKQKRGFRYFPFTCWSTTSALDGLRSGDALAHSVVTKKKIDESPLHRRDDRFERQRRTKQTKRGRQKGKSIQRNVSKALDRIGDRLRRLGLDDKTSNYSLIRDRNSCKRQKCTELQNPRRHFLRDDEKKNETIGPSTYKTGVLFLGVLTEASYESLVIPVFSTKITQSGPLCWWTCLPLILPRVLPLIDPFQRTKSGPLKSKAPPFSIRFAPDLSFSLRNKP